MQAQRHASFILNVHNQIEPLYIGDNKLKGCFQVPTLFLEDNNQPIHQKAKKNNLHDKHELCNTIKSFSINSIPIWPPFSNLTTQLVSESVNNT